MCIVVLDDQQTDQQYGLPLSIDLNQNTTSGDGKEIMKWYSIF